MVMTEGTSVPLLHVFKIVTHFHRKIAIWVSPSWKKVPDPTEKKLFFVREYFITDFKVLRRERDGREGAGGPVREREEGGRLRV